MNYIRKLLLLPAIVAAVLTSCINQDYSLKNLDTSVTVFKGFSITPEKEYDVNLTDITQGDGFKVDDNGTFVLPGEPSGPTNKPVTTDGIAGSSDIAFDGLVLTIVRKEVLPDCLFDGELNFHCPVYLVTDNPTNAAFMLSATLSSNGKTVKVSGVPVPSGHASIVLNQDDVMDLFCPFADDIRISDIVMKKPEGVAVEVLKDAFSVGAYAPLQLMPGDNMHFECDVDLVNYLGVLEFCNQMGISVKSFTAHLSVINSLPLDASMSLIPSEEWAGIGVQVDKMVAAGTKDNPVTTDLNVRVTSEDMLFPANLPFLVDAMVPAGLPGAVALSRDEGIVIRVNSVTLDNGFDYRF